MNLINLMPHRHRRLEKRRRHFAVGLGVSLLVGCVLVLVTLFTLERLHAKQLARNELLVQAKTALQKQEAQVRQLQSEIGVLQQRQATASSLQQQRNVPVAIFNELTRLVPPGLALVALRQNELKLVISGAASTNERVSDFMGRLQTDSAVLHQPELVEMRASAAAKPTRPVVGAPAAAPEADAASERMVDFTLTVLVRREILGAEVKR